MNELSVLAEKLSRSKLSRLTGAGASGRIVDVEVDHAVLAAAGERAGQVVAEGLLMAVVIVAVLALVKVCQSRTLNVRIPANITTRQQNL